MYLKNIIILVILSEISCNFILSDEAILYSFLLFFTLKKPTLNAEILSMMVSPQGLEKKNNPVLHLFYSKKIST